MFKELIISDQYADFWKGGCEFKGFTKGGADFEVKIRDVNSVSGENLHDFEIICLARRCERIPAPHAYGPVFIVKSQRVIFPRYSPFVQHWYNDHLFVRNQLLSLTYLEFFFLLLFFKVIYDQNFYLV